ncbi:hypothetical protein ACIVBQ_000190 [Tenacibaculum discolor]
MNPENKKAFKEILILLISTVLIVYFLFKFFVWK